VGGRALFPARPGLFLPDGFENREYLRFALKGTLAALICYGSVHRVRKRDEP